MSNLLDKDAEALALALTDHGQSVTVNGVSGTAIVTDMGESAANGPEFDQSRRTGRAILAKATFTLNRTEGASYGTLTDAGGTVWTITAIAGETAAAWQINLEVSDMNLTARVRTGGR
jgi:hypothetical protein